MTMSIIEMASHAPGIGRIQSYASQAKGVTDDI
jgi:hypothetical protein